MNKTMKILALEKDVPGVTAEQFPPHLQAEARRVWELYKAGIIREMYFRQEKTNAVLILECVGAAEAREILNTLPLVREKLIDFEIIPLLPYPGFERLFAV
jgi:hypothetical protein